MQKERELIYKKIFPGYDTDGYRQGNGDDAGTGIQNGKKDFIGITGKVVVTFSVYFLQKS